MADAFSSLKNIFGNDGASVADPNGFAFGRTARALAQSGVRRVVIRSQWLPTITLEPTFGADGQPAQPSAFSFGGFLKPSVSFEGDFGSIGPFEPYGHPSDDPLPKLIGVGALAVAGLGLVFGAVKLAKYGAIVGGGALALGYLRDRVST